MDLAKLKELAQKATPGPWTECGHGHEQDGCVCGMVYAGLVPAVCTVETDSPAEGVQRSREKKRADAAFIAAANPQVVMEIIAEVERLREANDMLRAEVERRLDQERQLPQLPLVATICENLRK